METIKKIYKIGYGPSSSHTIGPGIATNIFLSKHLDATSFKVELYGSLAMTGKGHLTDEIIKKILINYPTEIIFDYHTNYDYHPNGMKFIAYQEDKIIDEWLVFSVGGGDLKELNEERNNSIKDIYPHQNMENILKYCKEQNINLIDYIKRFEDPDIEDYLRVVLDTMKTCVKKGITVEGTLPGRLKVQRKAATFYRKYLETHQINHLVYAYALSVCEQNASGQTIVTAPTCGSAGIVPSVLLMYQELFNKDDNKLINALLIGGLIGNIVKNNASISGAEVGCQGEVGVACSMAASMIVYLNDGNDQMIEYAAEIALEHHLGLTCDPIDGMVQIPCIERNALAALFAMNAADYAMLNGGAHNVTLDSVIEVMKETGFDLQDKYKETSKGGLALRNK